MQDCIGVVIIQNQEYMLCSAHMLTCEYMGFEMVPADSLVREKGKVSDPGRLPDRGGTG